MGIGLRKTQWFPVGAETPAVFGDTVSQLGRVYAVGLQ